jgi:hypothetical protein
MKLQSLFPPSSAIIGLEEIYRQVGSDSFYFDAEGIRSNDKIITTRLASSTQLENVMCELCNFPLELCNALWDNRINLYFLKTSSLKITQYEKTNYCSSL